MLYSICGLTVDMCPKYELLANRAKPYLAQNQTLPADITVSITQEQIGQYMDKYNAGAPEAGEYSLAGILFFEQMIGYDGYVLHSSAIAVDGKGYLFTAPSGTGKSTHTKLWKQYFQNRAVYINDDKPVIRMINGKIYACGTPFSGKHNISSNNIVPVQGICVLEQGQVNSIKRLNMRDSIAAIYTQTYSKTDREQMAKRLDLIEQTVIQVPVYRLTCTISEQAVIAAYTAMLGQADGELGKEIT